MYGGLIFLGRIIFSFLFFGGSSNKYAVVCRDRMGWGVEFAGSAWGASSPWYNMQCAADNTLAIPHTA